MKIEKMKPFGLLVTFPGNQPISALDREQLLDWTTEFQLVVIRGLANISRSELLNLASQKADHSDLVQWNFGPVMEMKADPQAANYLFSREEVPFHWDGAFHEVPEFLLFHCLQAPNPEMGGETTFCQTERVLERAGDKERAEWKKVSLSYHTETLAHYGGSFRTSLIERHPRTKKEIMRFAEPVHSTLNPVELEIHGSNQAPTEIVSSIQKHLYADDCLYQHQWMENDILLADNFSLLHGRRAFSAASPRHLRRLQIRLRSTQ